MSTPFTVSPSGTLRARYLLPTKAEAWCCQQMPDTTAEQTHLPLQGHVQVAGSRGGLLPFGTRTCMPCKEQQLASLPPDLEKCSKQAEQKPCHVQLVRLNLLHYAINSWIFFITHRDLQDELRLTCAM